MTFFRATGSSLQCVPAAGPLPLPLSSNRRSMPSCWAGCPDLLGLVLSSSCLLVPSKVDAFCACLLCIDCRIVSGAMDYTVQLHELGEGEPKSQAGRTASASAVDMAG